MRVTNIGPRQDFESCLNTGGLPATPSCFRAAKMTPNHTVGEFSQGHYFNQRNGERGREGGKKRGSPHSQAYTFSHVLGQRTIIASFTDIKKKAKKKSIPQNMTKMLPVISSRDEKSAITKSLI